MGNKIKILTNELWNKILQRRFKENKSNKNNLSYLPWSFAGISSKKIKQLEFEEKYKNTFSQIKLTRRQK